MISTDKTVTIIGAGLAGLSAAYELHRAGWKITVLEARPRVGGRVYSVRSFAHGQVAEGGGEFIDASHTRMMALANEFNLKLGRVGSWQTQQGDWCSLDGKAGPVSDSSIWGTNLEEETEHVWRALAELGKLVSDPAQPQAARDASHLDPQSALDWIHSLDVHPLAKSHFIFATRSGAKLGNVLHKRALSSQFSRDRRERFDSLCIGRCSAGCTFEHNRDLHPAFA
jgi:monoamine oxidase